MAYWFAFKLIIFPTFDVDEELEVLEGLEELEELEELEVLDVLETDADEEPVVLPEAPADVEPDVEPDVAEVAVELPVVVVPPPVAVCWN